jgi:hypothetical protein
MSERGAAGIGWLCRPMPVETKPAESTGQTGILRRSERGPSGPPEGRERR